MWQVEKEGEVIGEFVSVTEALLFAVDVDAIVLDENGVEFFTPTPEFLALYRKRLT